MANVQLSAIICAMVVLSDPKPRWGSWASCWTSIQPHDTAASVFAVAAISLCMKYLKQGLQPCYPTSQRSILTTGLQSQSLSPCACLPKYLHFLCEARHLLEESWRATHPKIPNCTLVSVCSWELEKHGFKSLQTEEGFEPGPRIPGWML